MVSDRYMEVKETPISCAGPGKMQTKEVYIPSKMGRPQLLNEVQHDHGFWFRCVVVGQKRDQL